MLRGNLLISSEYREQNRVLHRTRQDYGISGQRWAATVVQLAKNIKAQTILDYGCGKGTLAKNVVGYEVIGYDPCIEGLDREPDPADIVACTDVLEHIEPDCLDGVLDHIASLTRKVGFFTIATRPAKKTLPDGRNAHLIQESPEWWLANLWKRFRIVQFNDLGGEFAVVVKPKC